MVPSTSELTDWLRQEVAKGNADEEYIWQDPVKCLMGRFYAARGQQGWGEVTYSDLPNYHIIAGQQPWTLGAALERAQTLQLPPPSPALIEQAKTGTLIKPV